MGDGQKIDIAAMYAELEQIVCAHRAAIVKVLKQLAKKVRTYDEEWEYKRDGRFALFQLRMGEDEDTIDFLWCPHRYREMFEDRQAFTETFLAARRLYLAEHPLHWLFSKRITLNTVRDPDFACLIVASAFDMDRQFIHRKNIRPREIMRLIGEGSFMSYQQAFEDFLPVDRQVVMACMATVKELFEATAPKARRGPARSSGSVSRRGRDYTAVEEPKDVLIRVSEAARVLGVNAGVVSRWANQGRLKTNGATGKKRRIFMSSVLLVKHEREEADRKGDVEEVLCDIQKKIPNRH